MFDHVIDRILWVVRRQNPVGDHQILVIVGPQYQRMALESITASLKEIDYVIDPAWVLLKYAAERSSSTRWIMWTCASCQQPRKKSAAGKWWGYATAA
jgi:hypothetical protein